MTWLFGNLWLKLLSIGLALMLWMVVSGEETVERGLRVPLELTQVPAGLELLGDVPATVDVRVRGASGTLSRVAAGEVVAVLDLHTAQSGRRLFPLTPEQVRVPFGVEIVQVQPSAVTMAFELSASREVPIVPAVDGRPAPGFVIGPLTAEPRLVEIIGPDSAVKRATEVVTEPVSVAGATTQVKQSVLLGLLDPALRLKTARSALVTVQILPAPLERTLRNQPVHLRNLGPNLQAEAVPPAVDLTVRGNRDTLGRVAADDLTAFIDLAGLGPGQYSLTVHADSSRDAGVTRVTPDAVQVRVTSGKQ
ncbi:MAG TPA: CdaR family protein [Vicinamibacterales bacterium]|nr:CdaR family protein [Vicinamibacterales bacterium]